MNSTNALFTRLQSMIDKACKPKRRCIAKFTRASDQSSAGELDNETSGSRQLMRPMKFDGTTSFETFLAHFRNCAEPNKWNETEQLSWLKGSLTKNAGQVLWDLSP